MPTPAATAALRRAVTLFFDADTFDVLWFCPVCGDSGQISGWEGTFWDNSNKGERPS